MAVCVTTFNEPSDRYEYDSLLLPKGYAQIDTRDDASYYGMWANPTARVIVEYAEGDVTITKCETDDDFAAELRKHDTWRRKEKPLRSGRGIGIDPWFNTELASAFTRVGVGDLLH